jgi:hypothetical protein
MIGRRCPCVVALVGAGILAAAFGAGASRATTAPAPLTVAVRLDGDAPRWHLDAWAGSLRYHLDRASKLTVVEAEADRPCTPSPGCHLDGWAGTADLVAVGTARGPQLQLTLWSVAARRELSATTVDTDRAPPDEQFRRAAVALARPIQLTDGRLDDAMSTASVSRRSLALLVMDLVGLLLLAALAVNARRRSPLLVLAIGLGALAATRGHSAGDLLVGILWGAWLVDVLPAVVAPAPRLDRAPGPLLSRAVLVIGRQSALRLLGLALVDGVALTVVVAIARLGGLSWADTLTGPALVAALLLRQALRALPDGLTRRLDKAHATERAASAGHHRAVMRTLRGHFRRQGLDEALDRLAGVDIIVTEGEDVVGYGELRHVRLLVGRDLLAAAGVTPAAGRDVNLRVDARWSAGLLVPRPMTTSTAAASRPASDEPPPRRLGRFLDRSKEVRGHRAPLDGWILPRRGRARPLLADTAADHAAVDALVSAPRARFGRPGYDDDHDDSEADHKDFLVGALVRELLRVQTASPLGGPTVSLWLARTRWAGAWTDLRRRLRPLLAVQATYGDLLVALHRSRDALVQDLGRRLGLDITLTARANGPLLMRRSLEVLAALEAQPAATSPRDEARRLVALAQLVTHAPQRRGARWPWLAAAAAALAVLGAATVDAVRYHPRYQALMAAEAERLVAPDSPPPVTGDAAQHNGTADDAR